MKFGETLALSDLRPSVGWVGDAYDNALAETTIVAPGITNGGTTVNGVSAPISDYVMPKGDQPY